MAKIIEFFFVYFPEPFSSLSTNDSLPWVPNSANSPTSTTSARMEWDSAGDVGNISVDMSQAKLSTLERVTLQGMALKGDSEKKVIVFLLIQ